MVGRKQIMRNWLIQTTQRSSLGPLSKSNTWGTFVEGESYEQIDENTEMQPDNYYVFAMDNGVVRAMGYLGQDQAIEAFLNVDTWANRIQTAYKAETGEETEVKYVSISYENVGYGGSLGVWIFRGVNIRVQIKDKGFAFTASVIVAIAIALSIIAFTLIGAWLIFRVIQASEEIFGEGGVIVIGLLILAGLGAFAYFMKGGKK